MARKPDRQGEGENALIGDGEQVGGTFQSQAFDVLLRRLAVAFENTR